MKTSIRNGSSLLALLTVFTLLLSGCASVPMGSKDEDTSAKAFAAPAQDKVGLYIYRNSFVGQALSKTLTVDNVVIGKTANKVYFFRLVSPGNHILSTESEFGDNSITLETEGGKNYFIRQYIKMGVFVGGSNLEVVTDEVGRKEVLECSLAKPL